MAQKLDLIMANPSTSAPSIKKNNYTPNPSVLNRPKVEVDQWLSTNDVELSGHNVPKPILSFAESTFSVPIVQQLSESFQQPTAIQSISWPVALSGNDLISIAKTDGGKTHGFTLPAIIHVLNQAPRRPDDGPIVVVLLPTRERAMQVELVARAYGQVMQLKVICCCAKTRKAPQIEALSQGVDICIAMPGRLNDFLNTNATSMNRCSFLVLDEADRMLDMGFEPQIRQIISRIRSDRQTLMFSATLPQEVRKLASDLLKDPVHLTVGSFEVAGPPQPPQAQPSPPQAHNVDWDVDSIEGSRLVDGKQQYLVKWSATWEPTENLNCPEKIEKYSRRDADDTTDDDSADDEQQHDHHPLLQPLVPQQQHDHQPLLQPLVPQQQHDHQPLLQPLVLQQQHDHQLLPLQQPLEPMQQQVPAKRRKDRGNTDSIKRREQARKRFNRFFNINN